MTKTIEARTRVHITSLRRLGIPSMLCLSVCWFRPTKDLKAYSDSIRRGARYKQEHMSCLTSLDLHQMCKLTLVFTASAFAKSNTRFFVCVTTVHGKNKFNLQTAFPRLVRTHVQLQLHMSSLTSLDLHQVCKQPSVVAPGRASRPNLGPILANLRQVAKVSQSEAKLGQ